MNSVQDETAWLKEIEGPDGEICIHRSNLSGLLARHQVHGAVRRAMDQLLAPRVRKRYRQVRKQELKINSDMLRYAGSAQSAQPAQPDPDKELSGEQIARDLAFTLDHLEVSFSRREAETAIGKALSKNHPGILQDQQDAWWRG